MNGTQIGHDAWTYHQFGARSFEEDIRAIIIDDLDQSPYRDAVSTHLREQASARPLPFLPISLERVTLETEPIDPYSVSVMPGLGLRVELDEHDQTLAHLRCFPELLAKVRDRVAQAVAADLVDGVFGGGYADGTIPVSRALTEILDRSIENRETLGLVLPQGISHDPVEVWPPAKAPGGYETD